MDNAQPLKILIVDDEKGTAYSLQEIYSHKGFVVFAATDSVSAVEIFKKEKPQICLIDIWISKPDDGIGLLEKFRAIDKDTYCIIMGSCFDEENVVKEAKRLGVLHLIDKPFEPKEIDNYIEEIKGLIARKNSDTHELFHDIGNCCHTITIGTGASREFIKVWLDKENGISQESRQELLDILENLDRIIESAEKADNLAREIESRLSKTSVSDADKPK